MTQETTERSDQVEEPGSSGRLSPVEEPGSSGGLSPVEEPGSSGGLSLERQQQKTIADQQSQIERLEAELERLSTRLKDVDEENTLLTAQAAQKLEQEAGKE